MNSAGMLSNFTVLIVDDEELIREVASMMIEEEGGTALQAEGPNSALAVLGSSKIDCIICDFSMPDMNGLELFKKVREIAPSIPFLMTSGLRMTPEVDALRKQEALNFIPKPFQHTDLMRILTKMLAQR